MMKLKTIAVNITKHLKGDLEEEHDIITGGQLDTIQLDIVCKIVETLRGRPYVTLLVD